MTKADRKIQILQAAKARFALQGLKKTTLDEIAGDVGLVKSALYKYYPSKEAIFDAVIDVIVQAHVAVGRRVILDYWGVRERLQALLFLSNELIRSHTGDFKIQPEVWAELRPVILKGANAAKGSFIDTLVEIFEQGKKTKEIVCEDPHLVANMIHLLVEQYHNEAIIGHAPEDNEEIRRYRTLITVILNGLAPRNGVS